MSALLTLSALISAYYFVVVVLPVNAAVAQPAQGRSAAGVVVAFASALARMPLPRLPSAAAVPHTKRETATTALKRIPDGAKQSLNDQRNEKRKKNLCHFTCY